MPSKTIPITSSHLDSKSASFKFRSAHVLSVVAIGANDVLFRCNIDLKIYDSAKRVHHQNPKLQDAGVVARRDPERDVRDSRVLLRTFLASPRKTKKTCACGT